MKVKVFIISMTLMLMVTIFTSCSALSTYQSPELNSSHVLLANCYSGPSTVTSCYEGVKTMFRTEFTSGNVNLDFEIEAIIYSPSVPKEYQIYVDSVYKPVVLSKEPGTAKGRLRADVVLDVPCNSSGPYRLTLAVTDSKGGSAVMHYDISAARTPATQMSDPCFCSTQCGPCSTLFSRYRCGCTVGNDVVLVNQWLENNPGTPLPEW